MLKFLLHFIFLNVPCQVDFGPEFVYEGTLLLLHQIRLLVDFVLDHIVQIYRVPGLSDLGLDLVRFLLQLPNLLAGAFIVLQKFVQPPLVGQPFRMVINNIAGLVQNHSEDLPARPRFRVERLGHGALLLSVVHARDEFNLNIIRL